MIQFTGFHRGTSAVEAIPEKTMSKLLTSLTLTYALDPLTNMLSLTVQPSGLTIPASELRRAEKELSRHYDLFVGSNCPPEFALPGSYSCLPTGPYQVTRLSHGPGHREPTIQLNFNAPGEPIVRSGAAESSGWETALSAGAAKLLATNSDQDPGLAASVRELVKLFDGDQEAIVMICLIGYLTVAQGQSRSRVAQIESLLTHALKSVEHWRIDSFTPIPNHVGDPGRRWWRWLGI